MEQVPLTLYYLSHNLRTKCFIHNIVECRLATASLNSQCRWTGICLLRVKSEYRSCPTSCQILLCLFYYDYFKFFSHHKSKGINNLIQYIELGIVSIKPIKHQVILLRKKLNDQKILRHRNFPVSFARYFKMSLLSR